MKRKGQIIIGLALILIFILMALAAPVLAPNDPNATNLALKNAPPSAEYPLGCDQMGRCELSRLLYGARYSMGLTIPVLIVLAAFALFVGCYSSYKGGLLDEVMRILCDILMAFPLIVIAMALVSAVDNSVASVIIAIGISMLAWFLRMVRSYAKTECGKEYIEAARIAGASGLRIVLRHLIPNVFPQFVVYFTTGIATAIMSVSSFAFLGVGLIAGTPEWGAMLNEARNSVYSNPALLIYPGICLIVCCAGFNLLGEGLANTIQRKNYDGRISQDNKAWAKTIPMLEDSGASHHCAYLVVDQVNPGLTDLFTRQFRKVAQEQQKSSVLQKLKQESPAHKPAAPKKREPER